MRRNFGWLGIALCWGILSACGRREPPGAVATEALDVVIAADSTAVVASEGIAPDQGAPTSAPKLGSLEDNLPFSQADLSLASIAWRTWIYTDTGPRRTRLGYLRAGAVVPARGPAIENSGCAGGWYRINPRGFVCVGKGATTDLSHPSLKATRWRPERGRGFPYDYALSQRKAPHRYFRLPTSQQMREAEGERVADRAAAFLQRAEESGLAEELALTRDVPEFLLGGTPIDKPYGVPAHERREVTSGQASPDSGFALLTSFIWEERAFALTSELDLIPLDRTDVVREPDFMGVVLEEGESLPVAFHVRGALTLWEESEAGQLRPAGEIRRQRAFKLTGRERKGMLETPEGIWIPKAGVRVLEPRDGFPSVATGARRWVDVSIKHQTLVAYEGTRPVFATLISAGRGGLGPKGDGNPDGSRTVRGTFMIHEKALSSTMDGDDDRADSFELKDVPHVQYFHRGFALHGAYWHDEFGRARSHGCVNLAAKDAAWLFEWTDPPLPPGWHAVQNKERGTVVYVGY